MLTNNQKAIIHRIQPIPRYLTTNSTIKLRARVAVCFQQLNKGNLAVFNNYTRYHWKYLTSRDLPCLTVQKYSY